MLSKVVTVRCQQNLSPCITVATNPVPEDLNDSSPIRIQHFL